MTAKAIVSLRDVAIRLGQLRGLINEKPDETKLLSLLVSGELKASFYFPGLVWRWIEVPKEFWMSIGTERFRSIRIRRGNKKKTGTFKVQIGEFADEYVRQLRKTENNTELNLSTRTNGGVVRRFKSL